MINRENKNLIKAFVFLFLASFMVINWNSISWIFNYRQVSGLLDDFFTPYENAEASPATIYSQNSSSQIKENQIEFAYSEKENIIEIPDIGISAPISFPENKNAEVLAKSLDKGPIYYPGSVLPAEKGQIIILGHSAPENWPKIKYDWVFSDIEKLVPGSRIFLYLNHKEYIYYVKEKSILEKGQEISPASLTNNDNTLILISCWPPGKNLQRIAVRAELSI
ncbi:MAG: sortase [Patescibacteria group bacterium]